MSIALTAEQIASSTGARLDRARVWLAPLSAAMAEFAITTPARAAAFLAQIGHESGGLRYTREIWGPTKAQVRYEGRKDLGNVIAGDGKKYMGRGLIQITGRSNYSQVQLALGIKCLDAPELLEQPKNAARASAWWWATRGLNGIADSRDMTKATRVINGGTNGLEERLALYKAACQACGA